LTREEDEAKIEQRVDEILKTGKPSPWDLAEYYVKKFTFPSDDVLAVCDLGVLPVKIFLYLLRGRGIQTTTEVSKNVGVHRTHTHTALRKLEDAGYVQHVKRRWKLIYGFAIGIVFAFFQLFKNFRVC
jgi:hypothetical protein